jgi:hypothetical protein
MIVVRSIVGVLAVVGAGAVLASVLRTVVLPRPVPARLARLAFSAVRALLFLRLRLTGRSDYRTRDRVFALQAPLGLFGQLFLWGVLIFACFAALFWSVSASRISGASVSTGSSSPAPRCSPSGLTGLAGWDGSWWRLPLRASA